MKSVVAVSFVLSALSGALASQNIVQLAQGNPDLSTLVTALTAGGLTGTLSGTGPFTVFAPTNEAFAKIDTKALNTLLANKAELDKVLEYHVLAANWHMLDLMSAKIIKTLEGENVTVSDACGVIKVGVGPGPGPGIAKVLTADVGASNGIVHVIDTVLMPPSIGALPPKWDIVQVAERNADLSTLVAALTAGKLAATLQGKGFFTVFAPTNEAFAKIDTKALYMLLANKTELDKVLEYHVLAGGVSFGNVSCLQTKLNWTTTFSTLEGENVKASGTGGVIKVDNAKVLTADVWASNGIVHVIDTVLMPPSMSPLPLKADIVQVAERNADLSTLVAALTAGKLVATLEGKGPFTVFAPTNKAFAKIPKATLTQLLGNQKLIDQLLEYHVLGGDFSMRDLMSAKLISTLEKEPVAVRSMGGKIMVNNANVVTADVGATNGVVHVVDKVLVPPDFPLSPYPEDVVELAESQPDLSTLVAALVAGKLTATLSGTGPFTVFAPTNEAFAKIPAADLQKLLANTKELDAVLESHVLAGKFDMRDLMAVRSAKTLEGDTVTVTGSSYSVNVNDAIVLKADLAATNGIVHVIDTVLGLPSPYQKSIVELAVANPDLSTLVTALKAADLVGTLSGKGPRGYWAFTVWGPSNKAFAKLPAGVLDNLLKPENKAELVDLLTYHVGFGLQTFHGSFHGESVLVNSMEGNDISVTSDFDCQGGPRHYCYQVDGQRFGNVVRASNGGLYAIDAVLTVPKVVVV